MGRPYSKHTEALSSGEVSYKVVSRYDIQDNQKGLRFLRNFLVQPQGGVIKRSGTRWLSTIEQASNSKLIPFVFNKETAFIIALYVKGSNMNVDVYTSAGVKVGATHSFSFNSSKFDINDIFYFQSGNSLFLMSHNFPIKIILRDEDDSSFSILNFEFNEPPYDSIIKESISFQALTHEGENYVRFPVSALPEPKDNYTHNNSQAQTNFYMRVKNGDNWYAYKIFDEPNAPSEILQDNMFVARAERIGFIEEEEASWQDFNITATEYRFSPYFFDDSVSSAHNQYYSTGGFYRGRLWLTGSRTNPQSVVASAPDDFFNFAPSNERGEVLASSGLNFTIDSNEAFEIDWIQDERRQIQFGTSSGVWFGQASSTSAAVSPFDFSVAIATRDGTSKVKPIAIDESTIYADRTGKKIRSLIYNYGSDAYPASDLNLLADHLFEHSIKEMFFARMPEKYVFVLDTGGNVFVMAYERENNIVGWSRLDFGGFVESIVIIPDSSGELDRLYFVIRRGDNRYLECMEDLFEGLRGDTLKDSWFLDSAEALGSDDVVPERLRGQNITFAYLGDDMNPTRSMSFMDTTDFGTATISEIFDLPNGFGADDKIIVGYSFSAEIQTLPRDFRTADGTSVGKVHSPQFITLQLASSGGFEFFSRKPVNDSERAKLKFDFDIVRQDDDDFYTGEVYIDKLENKLEREVSFYLESLMPAPLNLLSIATSFDISIKP